MPKQITHDLTELSNKTRLEDAFRVIAFSCIAQIESNAAILVKAHDVEGLHQMRIGFRRFNSLLEIYNILLKLPETLRLELRWVNQTLSENRDIDTLIHSTLPMVSKKMAFRAALAKLNPIIQNEAENKHRQLIAMINSKRYKKLMRDLNAFVFVRDWREGMPPKVQSQLFEQLDQATPIWLEQHRNALINQGKNINKAGRKKLHRIRIAAKRLRYASDFLQTLYSSKRVSTYIKKLSKLQDLLGFLNDALVANRLLKEIKTADASFQKELKLIRLSIQSAAEVKHKKIEALWSDFSSTKPFWKDKS